MMWFTCMEDSIFNKVNGSCITFFYISFRHKARWLPNSFSFLKVHDYISESNEITYQLQRNQSLLMSFKIVSNGRNKDFRVLCFYQILINAESETSYFTSKLHFSEHLINICSFLLPHKHWGQGSLIRVFWVRGGRQLEV